MRMDLSGLNAQRRYYNFIDHDLCPSCNQGPEDTFDFFLDCPVLAFPRAVMLRDISKIFDQNLLNIDVFSKSRNARNKINEVLLYGSDKLSFEKNGLVFEAVHAFIGTSQHFD
jgi:hypothetical protein